jgi:alpha-L-fucosidase 2
MTEMLLQSQSTVAGEGKGEVRILDLLPALPRDWPAGSVKGLRARGGFEVDLKWREGKLEQARITSLLGNVCELKTGNHSFTLKTRNGSSYLLDGQLRIMKQ